MDDTGIKSDIGAMLVQAPMPELRHLEIGPDSFASKLDLHRLSLAAPLLTTLRLWDSISVTPLECTQMTLHRLTRLEFYGTRDVNRTTPISWDVVTIASLLPALEVIAFKNMFPPSPRPKSIEPAHLAKGLKIIFLDTDHSSDSVVTLDECLIHPSAKRHVVLRGLDTASTISILRCAFANICVRPRGEATHDFQEGGASFAKGESFQPRPVGSFLVGLTVTRPTDAFAMHLAPNGFSNDEGGYVIYMWNVAHHLAHVLACIPLDGLQSFVFKDNANARLPWEYLKHSPTLAAVAINGISAEGFVRTLEKRPGTFVSLRRLAMSGCPTFDNDALPTRLSSALKKRKELGLPGLELLGVPETKGKDIAPLFRTVASNVRVERPMYSSNF
ncbi:hypothetical protein K488DRAFT_72140 [Vararia minispora EC-137]|uniref:Uncharacterized protein n=1 Tax=Vararia minispora EC-137 TaxID=1314806 RepID=A0ACB8QFZ4_9AGAM|nr:hypothetical protein K488DRAFT_72140 [Vararia minispora EC-137]